MDKEISAKEAAKLHANRNDSVLLDVREDSELEICRISGALHIPMSKIPEHTSALPKTAPLVVFCHHGMRSFNVVQFLEAKGFKNAINLAGGIHAWAHEVDPDMSTY